MSDTKGKAFLDSPDLVKTVAAWIERARDDETYLGPYRLCIPQGPRFALSVEDAKRAQAMGIPFRSATGTGQEAFAGISCEKCGGPRLPGQDLCDDCADPSEPCDKCGDPARPGMRDLETKRLLCDECEEEETGDEMAAEERHENQREADLLEAVKQALLDIDGAGLETRPQALRACTYQEAGLLTRDEGIVLTLRDGRVYQITVQRDHRHGI